MKTSRKSAASARNRNGMLKTKSPRNGQKKHSAAVPDAETAGRSPRANSKLGTVITMLRATKGATIDEIAKATEWQTHSVRGAISGAIKKKLGLKVTSEKADGVRTYRITG